MKNSIIIINIISIILAIFGIIIILYQNNNGGAFFSKRDHFYGPPPGRQRAISLKDLGNDRGWATFMCTHKTYDELSCDTLNGHRGVSPDAMSKYVEYSPIVEYGPIAIGPTSPYIENSIISQIVT